EEMSIFLSKYVNNLDKKGRTSVPASYRLALADQSFNGIIAYPSFRNKCIEACSLKRLEELSQIIQTLDPYSEERDAFETIILGEAIQLSLDSEGRIILPRSLIEHAGISEQGKIIRDMHKPVMLCEVKELLQPKDTGNYLDCTFGFGEYSRMIAKSCNGNIVAVDRDPSVKIYADQLINEYPSRIRFIQTDFAGSFVKLDSLKFDGIVMDLGVSSMQLDSGYRGFSFIHDGPLDMRMSSNGYSAEDFINEAEEQQIANVIYKYGDEIYSRKIARKIVEQRKQGAITTTFQLANIIRASIGFKRGKIDSATKTFQALRIYINDELEQLEQFLDNCRSILEQNGKLIIVTFHSLEDRIVKNFFKDNSVKVVAKSKYSVKSEPEGNSNKWLKILTKKPLTPTLKEITENPRARSAKLRAMQVFSYIVVMTVALSIYGLFTIKDKVASLHYQIETVSKQLIEENNMLHILKAEQAYLTSPVRLRKLSSLYLQLDTIKISQMVSDPSLPEDGKHLTISGDNLPHI
ncbi:Ribosomal RNA small subunit methyltransferase H, partial [Pseudolycoriella hygida]